MAVQNKWIITPERHYRELEDGRVLEIHVVDVGEDSPVFRACLSNVGEFHVLLGQADSRLAAMSIATEFATAMDLQ